MIWKRFGVDNLPYFNQIVIRASTIEAIEQNLTKARDKGLSVILDIAGAAANYRDSNGCFDPSLYVGRINEFELYDFDQWQDCLLGLFGPEKPEGAKWCGGLTSYEINLALSALKSMYSRTVLRTQPEYVNYQVLSDNLDVVWCVWSQKRLTEHSTLDNWINEVEDMAQGGYDVIWGLNVHRGGYNEQTGKEVPLLPNELDVLGRIMIDQGHTQLYKGRNYYIGDDAYKGVIDGLFDYSQIL